MNDRELLLLTPYTFPGQNPLMLANEDMAAWLNGYTALWHPALLWLAAKPPRSDAPYDYENPKAEHVYAVPESPPTFFPDDWPQRVQDAGAITFRATPDRRTTLANLKDALRAHAPPSEGWEALVDSPPEKVAPFFGLGLGYLLLSSLSEAMEHENLLDQAAFWDDIRCALSSLAGVPYTPRRALTPEAANEPYPSDYSEYMPATEPNESPRTTEFEEFAPGAESTNEEAASSAAANDPSPAVAGPDAWYGHLQDAAAKLLSAREVLYPVAIHLLDLVILDKDRLGDSWPTALAQGNPLNVVASSSLLEELATLQPEKMGELRQRVQADQIEVCGGGFLEREDPLLPIDSQLWNLLHGQEAARRLLDRDIQVFARKRFGFHPHMPLFLTSTGLQRVLLVAFDEAGLPQYHACSVSWSSPDGKQVDAFVRSPHPVDSPQTFFNLGHYWFKTTREDHVATLAFVHLTQPPAPWYDDMLELARLGPLLGQWTTLSRYLTESSSGDYGSILNPDEFHSDYLSERNSAHLPDPVSGFARHVRLRRRLDACWTLAALYRSLAGNGDTLQVEQPLREFEDDMEKSFANPEASLRDSAVEALDMLEQKIAAALTNRLQARAEVDQPGYMVLNPCSFTRRVGLELERVMAALPIAGPVKASQLDGDRLRVVLEVPPLGFAWIPQSGPPGTPAPPMRLRLADQNTLRNEFFEVEVDPGTGGLRAIRDHKTHLNRIGQRLVFNPGSLMRAESIHVTSAGPALGEIVSDGVLVGDQGQVLSRFRQRFRVWLGRPMLELRIEITPEQPPAGYPWHAYFGARFAWRDERAALLRGVSGTTHLTTHVRPQTPDFLELRLAGQSTVIFPGGLPFHQRHEGRMLDVILIPEGEKTTVFDLGIALDREQPMQTALGMASPVAVVPTSKGPPHVGASGWLFHLDASNLLLTRMTPGGQRRSEDDTDRETDAVTARLLECAGHSGQAELRCVRNPTRAAVLNARGSHLLEAHPSGDGVFFEISPNDLVQLQVEFS